MKSPTRTTGFILQSFRAKSVENHFDKSKIQNVIYEDITAGTHEAELLLELERGSGWRIIIPEILLGMYHYVQHAALLHTISIFQDAYGGVLCSRFHQRYFTPA